MNEPLEQLIDEILRAEEGKPREVWREGAREVRAALAVLEGDEVLTLCNEASALAETGFDRWGRFLADLVLEREWVLPEHLIRALQLRTVLGEGGAGDVMLFAKGLRHYPALRHSTSGALEGELLSVASALVKVHQTVRNHLVLDEAVRHLNDFEMSEDGTRHVVPVRAMFLQDPELVELVTEHAERADEIASIIRERHSADPLMLRDVLDGCAPLSSGIL